MFEFELDSLPVHKCHELDAYVKDCVKENAKREKRKASDKLRREKQRD